MKQKLYRLGAYKTCDLYYYIINKRNTNSLKNLNYLLFGLLYVNLIIYINLLLFCSLFLLAVI